MSDDAAKANYEEYRADVAALKAEASGTLDPTQTRIFRLELLLAALDTRLAALEVRLAKLENPSAAAWSAPYNPIGEALADPQGIAPVFRSKWRTV